MEKKIGIFLTGGGALGSFHIGFFKVLEEFGIKYDIVCGSSSGAIIGGAATYLCSQDMLEAWKNLTLGSVLKIDGEKICIKTCPRRTLQLYKETVLSCLRRDPNFMIDFDDIRSLLYDSLNGSDIRKSTIDFGVTATQLPSFEMKKFFKKDMNGNPLEYILASLHLPCFSDVLKASPFDGHAYVDLSRFRRYPLEMLAGCDEIFVVNLEAKNLKRFTKQIEQLFPGVKYTIVSWTNKRSILDFSEEATKGNFDDGIIETRTVLEKSLKRN